MKHYIYTWRNYDAETNHWTHGFGWISASTPESAISGVRTLAESPHAEVWLAPTPELPPCYFVSQEYTEDVLCVNASAVASDHAKFIRMMS